MIIKYILRIISILVWILKIILIFLYNEPIFLLIDSYGGYMSGIMASRYDENFKCAILSNPVLNMPFNVSITGKIPKKLNI